MQNTAAQAKAPTIQFIALSQLSASPTQPRKNFAEAELQKLAESIKEHGIIQPLNVRRKPGLFAEGDAELFEIIFGERRFRGAGIAELAEAPCIVRDWNDRQVIEAQLIENLQRQDLDPVEESESYHQTLELTNEGDGQKSYTVETLAEKIGKEATYIYTRLKFRNLPAEAKTALLEGTIGIKLAALIARIPSEPHREEAASKIIHPDFQEAPLSVRQAREMIQRDYMRELRRAPFDQGDATLVPNMGACTTCQLRTGNAPAIFGDVQRGDICTYPPCYRMKVDVIWQRAMENAKTEGKRILTPEESERLFNDDGKMAWDSPYVRLADLPGEDLLVPTTKRAPSWRDILRKGSVKVEIAVARSERGAVHELALLKDALTAARLARPELFITPRGQAAPATPPRPTEPPPAPKSGKTTPPAPSQPELPANNNAADEEAERQRAERAKTRTDLAVLKQVVATVVSRIESDALDVGAGFWMALLPLAVAHAGKEGTAFLADRRSLDPSIFAETPTDAAGILESQYSSGELPALIVELLLGQYLRFLGGENSPLLAPFLKGYEIDVAEIRRNVESAQKSPRPKKEKANE